MLIRDHDRLEDVSKLLKVLPQSVAASLPGQTPDKDLGVGSVPKWGIQDLGRDRTRARAWGWLMLHER